MVTITGQNFQYHKFVCNWGASGSTNASTTGQGNKTIATCPTPQHLPGNATLALYVRGRVHGLETGSIFSFYPTLLVSDVKHHRVIRFHAHTGAFVDIFVHESSGGLKRPQGLAFGPDRNLF